MSSSKFFCNKDCEYYPCHKDIEDINCLFCFCPLYPFKDCKGNYSLINGSIKDCSECVIPHVEDNYDYIIKRLKKCRKDFNNEN